MNQAQQAQPSKNGAAPQPPKREFPKPGVTACYNCKFYVKSAQTLEDGREVELMHGFCRRRPPQVLLIPGGTEIGTYQSGFPTVSASAWCGEFVKIGGIRK
jgi:hypothetical protein